MTMMTQEHPREFSEEERRQLKSTIKWALRPTAWRKIETRQGFFRAWFERKLDALAAYALSDKSRLSERAIEAVKLRYEWGWSERAVAAYLAVSERTVRYDVSDVLDEVIRTSPAQLLAALRPRVYKWRLKGCLKCQGDLSWDEENGDYHCWLCGRHYDEDGNPVTHQM